MKDLNNTWLDKLFAKIGFGGERKFRVGIPSDSTLFREETSTPYLYYHAGGYKWNKIGVLKIDRPEIGATKSNQSFCSLKLDVNPHYCLEAYLTTKKDIRCIDNKFVNEVLVNLYFGVSIYSYDFLESKNSLGTKQLNSYEIREHQTK